MKKIKAFRDDLFPKQAKIFKPTMKYMENKLIAPLIDRVVQILIEINSVADKEIKGK